MDVQLKLNHIALLQNRAQNSGNTILLKVPVLSPSGPPCAWTPITVAEFAADVDRVAIFFLAELNARAIPPRSVVTLLSSGTRYQDLVYTIALCRVSYVPHMCTPMWSHAAVIFGLMEKAGSKMILYDPSLENLTANCPSPKMALSAMELITNSSTIDAESVLPRSEDLSSSSDVGFVFQTSGSTGGSPKIVPWTHQGLSAALVWLDGERFETQDIFLGLSSISHLPGLTQYLRCLYTGSCFIKPTMGPVPNNELLNMFNLAGLNRILTYGTWLAPHIQGAKEDPAILKLLQGLRTVSYTGVALSKADDDWCFQNGIRVVAVFGTTECGPIMTTAPGKPSRFIRPIPDISYRFDPVTDITILADKLSSVQLFEFVLLADSPQIPRPHLLAADGNYHPGDLFEKQPDGSYLSYGRDDDWIKNADTDRTDTKAIEEQIYARCSDLIKECVVVGHRRPSPALFVEVQRDSELENLSATSEDNLKELIIQRMEDFNAQLYVHEQIKDKRLIFVVNEGILPRTLKGNIRRRAIELKYPNELDAMYMSVYGPQVL